MRHGQLFHTPYPRSVPSVVGAEADAVVGGVGVEEGAIVAVVAAAASPSPSHQTRPLLTGIGAPSTLTSRRESGPDARTILNTEKTLFSVRNRRHVPGKMCTLQDLLNETGTSSVTHL